tara:strand:- start:1765 stop:2034 length:270 start_codon:yes stop_codon:yes gene_type:complete
MRKVNGDGTETIVRKVEEEDGDTYIEKETIDQEQDKTVTVEQTSDFFGDTETVVSTTTTPKKRMRKSVPKKKLIKPAPKKKKVSGKKKK